MGGRGTSSGGGRAGGGGAKASGAMAPWMKGKTEDEWEAQVRSASGDLNRATREMEDTQVTIRRMEGNRSTALANRDQYADMARQVGRNTDAGKAYMAQSAKYGDEAKTLARDLSSAKSRVADLKVVTSKYSKDYETLVKDVANYYKAKP